MNVRLVLRACVLSSIWIASMVGWAAGSGLRQAPYSSGNSATPWAGDEPEERSGMLPKQDDSRGEAIPSYQPRFGRSRPVIVVVGQNAGTELTDFVVPYGILAESQAAEVWTVSIQAGPIHLRPALTVQAQTTIEGFDARLPEGADYLIVPAVACPEEPTLLNWIRAQAVKGATVIGICDGGLVLGRAGLLDGHRATGHWFTHRRRVKHFERTAWLQNRRYVVDGNIVTTSGISASVPAALALVEAVAGSARARKVADELGASTWTPTHVSTQFRFGARQLFTLLGNTLAFWSHEKVGIPVAQDTDEIALALMADAYSRTFRSKAFSIATTKDLIRTRHGLDLLPDRSTEAMTSMNRILTLPKAAPVQALDAALAGIRSHYGRRTADWVADQMEYAKP